LTSNPRRRARGEGSVYRRASDGLWVGSVDLGRKENGKRDRRPVYGRTRAEAVEKIKRARERADKNLPLPTQRGSVADFMERWLESQEDVLRAKTVTGYRNTNRYYIEPYIGHIALAKLSVDDVENMMAKLRGRGLSPRTRRLARTVLRRALSKAEAQGRVARNVAALVDGPRGTNEEKRTLTVDEARRLLKGSADHWLGGIIRVGMSLGLRPGESLGLRWEDVDWEEKLIRPRKSVQSIDKKLVLEELKTKGSRAPIDLPDVCVTALKAERARQNRMRLKAGEAWHNEYGLIFTTRLGGMIDPANLRHGLSRLTKKLGLGHWTPHEVWRHTAASLLFAMDVPIEVISKVLRHSSVRVTQEVYVHLMKPQRQAAAAAMDAALRDVR
jgi:integrase